MYTASITVSLWTSIPIEIIDEDIGLALLLGATPIVACGSGAKPLGLPLTHGNPIRLGQPFHIF